jgi:hypothetical protein
VRYITPVNITFGEKSLEKRFTPDARGTGESDANVAHIYAAQQGMLLLDPPVKPFARKTWIMMMMQ